MHMYININNFFSFTVVRVWTYRSQLAGVLPIFRNVNWSTVLHTTWQMVPGTAENEISPNTFSNFWHHQHIIVAVAEVVGWRIQANKFLHTGRSSLVQTHVDRENEYVVQI